MLIKYIVLENTSYFPQKKKTRNGQPHFAPIIKTFVLNHQIITSQPLRYSTGFLTFLPQFSDIFKKHLAENAVTTQKRDF